MRQMREYRGDLGARDIKRRILKIGRATNNDGGGLLDNCTAARLTGLVEGRATRRKMKEKRKKKRIYSQSNIEFHNKHNNKQDCRKAAKGTAAETVLMTRTSSPDFQDNHKKEVLQC